MASRFLVRLWHCVTVASFRRRREQTGLPTMSERPKTTACLPAISTPVDSRRAMTLAGVQGSNRGSAALEDSMPIFWAENLFDTTSIN
jgi:hypothetical protein